MNVLSLNTQAEITADLTEGCSIRSVERLTGVHRDTIMRLGVSVGRGCAGLHDRTFNGLRVGRIEIDEIHSYVGKRQRKYAPQEPVDRGDQYLFTALASSSKAILSYRLGKRDTNNTEAFLGDLRSRVLGKPEISSDGFVPYDSYVPVYFDGSPYGQIIKHLAVQATKDAARRYAPGRVVAVQRYAVVGEPEHISTSYVERSNLSIRMACRRFARLTNAFSKKFENHAAAVSLFVAHYNFCRVHETTRTTPALSLGLTDHVWSVSELVQAALTQKPTLTIGGGRRVGGLTVIDGGLST
ncbi:MAG: transposase [Bauldia sp.]